MTDKVVNHVPPIPPGTPVALVRVSLAAALKSRTVLERAKDSQTYKNNEGMIARMEEYIGAGK